MTFLYIAGGYLFIGYIFAIILRCVEKKFLKDNCRGGGYIIMAILGWPIGLTFVVMWMFFKFLVHLEDIVEIISDKIVGK